jgi:hypothetical protein
VATITEAAATMTMTTCMISQANARARSKQATSASIFCAILQSMRALAEQKRGSGSGSACLATFGLGLV